MSKAMNDLIWRVGWLVDYALTDEAGEPPASYFGVAEGTLIQLGHAHSRMILTRWVRANGEALQLIREADPNVGDTEAARWSAQADVLFGQLARSLQEAA